MKNNKNDKDLDELNNVSLNKTPYFFSKPFRNDKLRHEEVLKFWSEFHQRIDKKINHLSKEQENIYWRIWRIQDLLLQHYYDYECAENPNNFSDLIKTYKDNNPVNPENLLLDNLYDRASRLDVILGDIGNLIIELELLLDAQSTEKINNLNNTKK